MKDTITRSLDEATRVCKQFSRLRFPKETKALLNSGIVAYYFSDESQPGWTCWPHFPVGKNRSLVKDLLAKSIEIPSEVKVIIEVNKRDDLTVENFMLDCFGHTILYLTNPEASNECTDAMRMIKRLKIYYK